MYDNISGNTGDAAIGISLKKMMKELKVDFEEVLLNDISSLKYDTVIIGGGHLIRENSDFFYDKFKLSGRNILNAVGVVGNPKDLYYLRDYKYVTFRSTGDMKKAQYTGKESSVVPCTTMLLEDLTGSFPIEIKKPSIGIHLIPNIFSGEDEEILIEWISKLPYNIYFIPITHYNYDYNYMYKLSKRIPNATILPIMKPLEVFTVMGKFNYVITCSLHGSIFSYIHNVPFILMDQEKSRFFLEDRNLQANLFRNLKEMINLSEAMLNKPLDYSKLISKDKKTLDNHMKTIKELIPGNGVSLINESNKNCEETQLNMQNSILENNMNKLICELEQYKINLRNANYELNKCRKKSLYYQNSLYKIHNSRGWKFLKKLYSIEDFLMKKVKTIFWC